MSDVHSPMCNSEREICAERKTKRLNVNSLSKDMVLTTDSTQSQHQVPIHVWLFKFLLSVVVDVIFFRCFVHRMWCTKTMVLSRFERSFVECLSSLSLRSLSIWLWQFQAFYKMPVKKNCTSECESTRMVNVYITQIELSLAIQYDFSISTIWQNPRKRIEIVHFTNKNW